MIGNCMYSSFALNENKIWYITRDDNLLMEVDIVSHTLECLGKIPNTQKGPCIYRTLFYRNNCLYLIPYNAEDIWKYDIGMKTFSAMDVLSDYSDIAGSDKKLYGILEYGNEVILYGLNSVVFRIDLEANAVKTYQMQHCPKSDISTWFMEEGFVYDDKLFLLVNSHLMVVVIDLKNSKVNYLNVDVDIADGIHQKIFRENEMLYYVTIDKKWKLHVVKMNLVDMAVIAHDTYLCEYMEKIDSEHTPFQCGFIYDKKLVFLPGQQLVGYLLDLNTKQHEIKHFFPAINKEALEGMQKHSYNYFALIYLDSMGLYFSINWELKKMIFINPMNLEIQDFDILYKNIPENQYINVINQIVDNSTVLYEKDRYVSLQDLINIIVAS